jgi:hypothetical protein
MGVLPLGAPPGTASLSTDIRAVSRSLATARGRGKFTANDLWRHPSFEPARSHAVGRRFRTSFRHPRLIIHCLLPYREDGRITPGMRKPISTRLQAAVRSKITRKQALRILDS